MSPDEGIRLWKTYMTPLISEGIQLYSPSTSNAPSGMDWWDEFFRKCPECKEQTSALNAHYYSNNADGMIEYIKELRARYNLPIYVSEFGCAVRSSSFRVFCRAFADMFYFHTELVRPRRC